jgi:WD40 repeat protein
VRALEGRPKAFLASWCVSADGRRLLVGTGFWAAQQKGKSGPVDVSLRAWDLTTGKELPALDGHTAPVYACALSPDGRTAVSCASGFLDKGQPHPDTTIRVWDTDTGKELRRLPGEAQPVYAAAFTLDGKQVVTASHVPRLKDGQGQSTVRVWDAAGGKPVRSFPGPGVRPGQSRLFFLPKDDRFVLATATGDDEQVSVWGLRGGTRVRSLFVPRGDGHSVSADGRFAVSAHTGPVTSGGLTITDAPVVVVWDVQKSTPKGAVAAVQFFKGEENTPAWAETARKRVGYPLLAPDGRRAVLANGDRLLMFALPW